VREIEIEAVNSVVNSKRRSKFAAGAGDRDRGAAAQWNLNRALQPE
jgi:hypothetical protein